MSEIEKKAAERLEKAIPMLNDYNKGRIIGIGEGLAMALESQGADNAQESEKLTAQILDERKRA